MLGIIKQGKIEPLEPINLPEGTKIVIAPLNAIITETENWRNFSMEGLNEAYGEDEPEYTVNHLKKLNPHYEAQ